MSLPTPSQSVSHKRFHQCVDNKKKVILRDPFPTFGSFSFFQACLWLGVDKVVLQKLKKSYKIYFNVASWFPGNVRLKPHSTHRAPWHPLTAPLNFYVNMQNTSFASFDAAIFRYWLILVIHELLHYFLRVIETTL